MLYSIVSIDVIIDVLKDFMLSHITLYNSSQYFVSRKIGVPVPRQEIIVVNCGCVRQSNFREVACEIRKGLTVSTAHSSLARECGPAVHYSPVVEYYVMGNEYSGPSERR